MNGRNDAAELGPATRRCVYINGRKIVAEHKIEMSDPVLRKMRIVRLNRIARRIQGECPGMQGELFR